MEFRVLGPLEVWEGGRPLELRRPKHRALLAALLLRAGQAVSVDQLLDDLWGERPPPTAKGSLQNLVSALRKQLGEKMLRTEPPGYLLDVARDAVDLFRFERLLEEARGAAGPEERAEKLRAALALWRGPPLADLAFEPFVLLEAPRLEDLRLAAHEELIEVRLAFGEHTQLLPELEALVAEHPFNERLRGQLMLALYRAGQQAEALDLYREARRLLVEQLGLEPSTPLRDLEQAILRHDPELTPLTTKRPSLLPTRKTATVLYADLAASHVLAAPPDPETLGRLLERYSTVSQRALEGHGGMVEILGGGALMAIFGVPQAHEDDALRSLRAAIDLREEMQALGGELEPRIGVSTGEVFVGSSAPASVSGAVIGAAKRLEEAAAAGEILLGAATVRLARDAVKVSPLEQRPLGKEGLLDAWPLLELIEGAPAIPRRFEAPLVGRRQELAELRRAFEAMNTDSRFRLVVLVGEPGIGKTRLAREFVSAVAQEASVLVGRCASYGQGATWLPLVEILREAGAETPESLSALLSAEQDGGLVARRIAGATGLADDPAPLEETNWAFRRLFETLASRRPLVVVFEDVHWAEPTLLDLIEQLEEQASGPVLLLCLTRPELFETRAAWAQRALTLAPLPEAEVGMLVDSLQVDLDADGRARVVEFAEGNPLFAEQLVVHASEKGADSLDLASPSIEALLVSRLDFLSTEQRVLLQSAAVIGRRFSRAAVLNLSLADPAATDVTLRSLIEKGLLRQVEGENSMAFHHVLVRNAAYAGIPKGVRADSHERAADWLERAAGTRLQEYEEIVGYHLEQAVRYRSELELVDGRARSLAARAAECFGRAGRRALARSDARAAAALLRRATSLLDLRDPSRLSLLPELGRALCESGDLDGAEAVLEDVIEQARATADDTLEARALVWKLNVGPLRGAALEECLAGTTRVIAVLERAEDDIGLAQALLLAGKLEFWLGQSAVAARSLERALVNARRASDRRDEIETISWLLIGLTFGATPATEAIGRCEEIRRHAAGEPLLEAFTLTARAYLDAMQGRMKRSRTTIARGRELFRDLGARVTWAGAGQVAGSIELLGGDALGAERVLRPAFDLLEQVGEVAFLSTVAADLSEALYRQGQYDEADRFNHVSEEAAAPDDILSQASWRAVRAKLTARDGVFEEAERLARDGVEIAAKTDYLDLRGRTLMSLAEVLRLGGRGAEGMRVGQEALVMFEEKENLVSARRARELVLSN
jgi:DNA-binding SARP family transcriptional activator/tetratricopeptide (TPR) repeat protein